VIRIVHAFALLVVALLASMLPMGSVSACGPSSDCMVEDGSYRIRMPARPRADAGGLPAILFFHGWQATPVDAMANADLAALGERLGVAVIAPEGRGKTWSYPGWRGNARDDLAFVDSVLRDAAPRFGLDSRRLLATGFSQGGSMVWWLACRMPTRFAVFAPVAGAFWEPLPIRCAAPMPTLLHVHGASDVTVPMSGRWIGSQFKQGDVRQSFAVMGGECPPLAPQPGIGDGRLTCERTGPCAGGKALQLCLHKGGHEFDPAWVEQAWREGVRLGLL
jgi:polyhydroxybutyrate depolymerase